MLLRLGMTCKLRLLSTWLKVGNSYDTWHGMLHNYWMYASLWYLGTKNVARELKKVTEGRVRYRNVTWFPELTDKRKWIDVEVRIMSLINVCSFRAQYQDTLVLGHEELWWGSWCSTADGSQHPQPLQGKCHFHYCTDSKFLVQGDHSNCHASSPCDMAAYIPSRDHQQEDRRGAP